MTGQQIGENKKVHACPACGGAVACGMANGDAACWCTALPHVLPVADAVGAQCYCQACLEALIRSRAQRQA